MRTILENILQFASDKRGNIGMMVGLLTPMLMGVAFSVVDYSNLAGVRNDLQLAADNAALSAARELRLANASEDNVLTVAKNHVEANLGRSVTFSGNVDDNHTLVTVELSDQVSTYFVSTIGLSSNSVSVKATAKVLGGTPSCMIGLDQNSGKTIDIDTARVTAPQCAVYSSSTSPNGLEVKSGGSVSASFICTSGGFNGTGGWISPSPQTDCPTSPDPLANRPPPTYGDCDYTNKSTAFVTTLLPGVYCGGLTVESGSVVTLVAGNYIIKDGKFRVKNGAVVNGVGTGFYLTGNNASFDFDPSSAISLTAPLTGPLAGMLFFEDRSNTVGGVNRMNSRAAPVLLGTFYLSRSTLEVGSPGGAGLLQSVVGALSAWTIVVANKVSINDGLNLTLNSNYSATQVPVPDGVGNLSAKIQLLN